MQDSLTQSPAPAKKSFLCAFPLVLIGALLFLIWENAEVTMLGAWMLPTLGAFYVGVGVLLLCSASLVTRLLGVLAWAPLVLAIPVGTIAGLLAIRRLLFPPRDAGPRDIPEEARTRTGRTALIGRLLQDAFGMSAPALLSTESFRHALGISPMGIASFLDSLHSEHAFNVSGDDAGTVDSVPQLIALLDVRHPCSQG